MTEKLIVEWVNFWIKKKSIKNIIVSGGVFMNIKANKELLDLDTVRSLFVVPSSGDESCVFGALWKINKKENVNTTKITNLYYGINFKDKAEKFIKDNNIEKEYELLKFDNYVKLNEHVSQLLSENKIIGRCSGREEWGARALGNRSIICNPSKLENIRLINSTIKERDYWMPFSPTILDIDEKKYLYNKKNFENNFMTCLFDSTDVAQKDLVCAIHPIDFTLRPQILKESQNPSYYNLISQFKEKTGIGAVLNTSFNLHGFPNVSSHEDAFITFKKSNLKYLIIENFLIKKN
jgi:carbamoyltransferase